MAKNWCQERDLARLDAHILRDIESELSRDLRVKSREKVLILECRCM